MHDAPVVWLKTGSSNPLRSTCMGCSGSCHGGLVKAEGSTALSKTPGKDSDVAWPKDDSVPWPGDDPLSVAVRAILHGGRWVHCDVPNFGHGAIFFRVSRALINTLERLRN